MSGPRPATRCSFCGTHQDECASLLKGQGSAMICEACVSDAVRMIAIEARQQRGKSLVLVLPTPDDTNVVPLTPHAVRADMPPAVVHEPLGRP